MISAEFSRMIFGSFKHARLNEQRDRVNRLGMRRKNLRVLDTLPEGLTASIKPSRENADPGLRRRRRRILRDQIREICKDAESRELLKRVWLKGESIRQVAADLGMGESTARSIECRCWRALGLPLRRRKNPTQQHPDTE